MRSAKKGPVTTVKLSQLVYCDNHKLTSTLASFLSDEGFTKVSKFMRENGKKSPVKRNTTLTWEELSPALLETITPLTIAEPNPDDDLSF